MKAQGLKILGVKTIGGEGVVVVAAYRDRYISIYIHYTYTLIDIYIYIHTIYTEYLSKSNTIQQKIQSPSESASIFGRIMVIFLFVHLSMLIAIRSLHDFMMGSAVPINSLTESSPRSLIVHSGIN